VEGRERGRTVDRNSDRYHSIGISHPRVDSRGKVSGQTRFLPDIRVEGMLYAYPVYSPVPFGTLNGIDDTDARKVAGYIGLVTAKDVPGENQVGVVVEDQPLFAEQTVRFVGDTVALVVAETESAAREAASLVKLSIEESDPYFSIMASRDAKENFIHENNIASQHQVDKGDVESGFEQADFIFEEEFSTPYQEHYYLEPQGCIASMTDDGRMEITGSLQCPFYVLKAVSKSLAMPFSKVRVTQSPVGGAFGGKEDIPSEVCTRTAIAAMKFKRPVRMVYHRHDDVQMSSKRHPFEMRYKVGVKKDGTLVAADVDLHGNAGAYITLSPVVSYRGAMQAMGPYKVPNIKVRSTHWYTNLPPTGAFRGFGSPQVTFGHERMMDIIAESLKIDPIELRLKNLLHEEDETMTGHLLKASVGVDETMQRVRKASSWDERKKSEKENGRYLRGIGVATSHYGNCLGAAGWALDGAGVKIQVRRDGSIAVAFGLVEMGQGALTVVTQMTAEALGVSTERISILPTDTMNVPDSGPSVASRNVVMTGNAIRDAATRLVPIFKSAAAEMFGCAEADVEIVDDRVINHKSGDSTGFRDLADYLYISNRPMDTLGWWHVPKLEFDPKRGYGQAYFTYSYSTHVAEVTVDKLTGLVHVDRIWAAHDIGQAINPAGIEGQVEGGTAQGIGWALTEDFKTENGHVTTSNLTTYLLPTAKDVAEVETIIVEAPEPLGPWGAKGVGEPAIIPTGAAIANAVSDALGVQIHHLPIRPEMVLDVLEGVEP